MNHMESVLNAVAAERARQDARWGEQNHDAYTYLAILTEEVGEAAQAALHDQFGGKAAGTLEAEVIQIAAVAVAWVECIRRRTGLSPEEEHHEQIRDLGEH